MNRSMIMYASIPLVAALAGCPSDDAPSDDANDETGIGVTSTSTSSTGEDEVSTTLDTSATTLDTSSETADGTTTSSDGMNCGEVSIVPTYIPPYIVMVVDASASMVNNVWDHDLDDNTADVTRWNTLHGVVDTVMQNFGSAMYAGIQRFPSSDACPDATPQNSACYNIDSCTTNTTPEVGVALDNGAAILAAIPGPDAGNTEVVGGTPATKGINSAVNHLLSQGGANPNYILLITDGAANCNTTLDFPDYIEFYDETLPTTVQAAYDDDGITTFVVGIDIVDQLLGAGMDGAPEANPYERLNDVALAGGAPKNEGMDAEKFFNTTNQQELIDAIEAILGEVTDCTIDLTMTDEGAPDSQQIPYVEFEVGGEEVPKVDDCDSEDGWTWVTEGEIMTFCGSYCEDFKSGAASFDGTYGCPPAG
ncbi:VWA domain-containing protein [Pseudenhygromyxa sp. WMMC2535]|uniref:VWA domain-containing protein n=1 Tax=Pseudenhygromyxa sp. WMMC2535 TaxID=2712867 RepID=UPI001551DE65|nr:VWA domain-containing protein [Pseudenhygromyxa sp. WMMC2535]NVB36944.1 VWA domain-containing protein [Pseudenhygromyxa sp. WMMC2535]